MIDRCLAPFTEIHVPGLRAGRGSWLRPSLPLVLIALCPRVAARGSAAAVQQARNFVLVASLVPTDGRWRFPWVAEDGPAPVATGPEAPAPADPGNAGDDYNWTEENRKMRNAAVRWILTKP